MAILFTRHDKLARGVEIYHVETANVFNQQYWHSIRLYVSDEKAEKTDNTSESQAQVTKIVHVPLRLVSMATRLCLGSPVGYYLGPLPYEEQCAACNRQKVSVRMKRNTDNTVIKVVLPNRSLLGYVTDTAQASQAS